MDETQNDSNPTPTAFGHSTPPHEPFDPSSTHSTPSPRSSPLEIANTIDAIPSTISSEEKNCEPDELIQEEESDIASSPDYDYLATAEEESLPTSSPDYDYLADVDDGGKLLTQAIPDVNKPLEAPVNNEYEYVIRDGEEYILGTLMVRVLQAKNVKVRSYELVGSMMEILFVALATLSKYLITSCVLKSQTHISSIIDSTTMEVSRHSS